MNLLFLSTAFPQPADPVRARYNLELCEALAEEHSVTVISPVRWTEAHAAQRPLTALPRVHYPTFLYPPGMLQSTHAWWLWQSIRATARAVVNQGAPDAIISYWTWPDGAAAVRLARSCQAPAVLIVGGSDVLVLSSRPAHRRRVERTLVQASAVVVVSEQLRREVAALGVPPERIAVVRRGVDRGVFAPGSRSAARQRLGISNTDQILLWVGRLSFVKGPDLLLDALEQLASRGVRPWRCVIVGDGPLRAGVMRRVRGGTLEGRVAFIDRLDPPALADWYRAADALVVSSRSEGVPNVLYEAKACGTPVVATDVGDVAAFLDTGNDRLVPPGDAARLAAGIAEVLTSSGSTRAPQLLPTWQDSAAAVTDVILRSHRRTPSPRIAPVIAAAESRRKRA
jgi:glycosyltransferase involved in cell wall biosynthesis